METTVKKNPALYILLVCLALGTAAGIALAALAYVNSRNMLAIMERNFTDPNAATQEDDVRVANFTIQSTLPISDAYRSGDTSALDGKQKETLDMASSVLDEIIAGGMTPYEQEKAVYDWMTHNLQNDGSLLTVIPATQADCDNPYGVLKYHNAVCVGYATTFRLFMEMLDIPCMVVHNTDQYHSWNLVQLDGEWYHTDIYSDAGSGNYSHFNLTDAMLGNYGQSWDTDFFPAANSVKYNVAYLESEEGPDIFEIPALVRAALEDADTPLLSFRYGLDFTEKQAQMVSEMRDQIQSVLWSATGALENTSLSLTFSPAEDGYLLTITLYRPDNNGGVELTEEDYQRVSEAVNAAFENLNEEDSLGDEDVGATAEPVIGGGAG